MLDFDELDELEGNDPEEEKEEEEEEAGGSDFVETAPEPEDTCDLPRPQHVANGSTAGEHAIERHTSPTSLTVQEARSALQKLIAIYVQASFQDRLHARWGELGEDLPRWEEARDELSLEAQIKVAKAMGFEGNQAGAAVMRSALLLYVDNDPEASHKDKMITWLIEPTLQKTVAVPTGPARCKIAATARIYSSTQAHVCRLEVRISDTIRCLKENIYLSTRKPWMQQKLYLGATELFDQVLLSSLMRVAATTEFRLEYRAPHIIDWLMRLKKEGAKCLAEAPADLLEDSDFMFPAVQMEARVLGRAANALRADRTFVLQLASHCGQALKYAAEELAGDRELVLASIRQDPWALELASEELRADRQVVLEAVARDSWALQFASPELRRDEELVLAAVEKDPSIILQVLPELQKDRKAVLGAIQKDWNILASLSPEMRSDKEMCLAAVRQNGWALQHVSKERLADREIVMEAMRNHADALRFAAPELYSDREVLYTAVQQSGTALGLANKDVQDLDMAIAAVKQDKRALPFVAKRLRPDVLKWLGLDRMPEWARSTDDKEDDFRENTEAKSQSPFGSNKLDHFYVVLDVPPTASKEEIKRKYHQLVLHYHPDKYAGDPAYAKQMFVKIQEAYEALSDALSL